MTAPLAAGNGRVKEARKLNRRPERSGRRLFLAEGSKALTEALLVPDCVVEVFATAAAGETYDALRKATDDAGIPWTTVADVAMEGLADAVTPQGIVAVCRFLDVSLESVLEAADGTLAICADVRDPGNAGTIIRTADAVGAAGVVLAGNSVDPYNPKTVRATVGSLFHLPVALASDVAATIAAVQAAGYTVLAADGGGELSLADAPLTGRIAWLFGNEAWGLPAEIAALADHRVSIPIHGRAESLNLSTAAAVCLYAGVLRG